MSFTYKSSTSTQSKLQDVFECVKLFEVEGSSAPAGGDAPTHGFDARGSTSISIEQCSWREAQAMTSLALVCNNGYLVFRITLNGGSALIKQLKWFESREKHILGVTFDPLGEWLACACLDGSLCLIPVYSLLTGNTPHEMFGPLDDLTTIQPSRRTASPTSMVWWESMDNSHMVITGSEVGEIMFFNLSQSKVIASMQAGGCINKLLLAQRPDTSTHLLIGLRGGQWCRMLLEEHFHEIAGTSYDDAHKSGYEVVPDDIIIKNYITSNWGEEQPELRAFPLFSELTDISVHDWPSHHLLSALNLRSHKTEVYSYDFDTNSIPVRAYQLVPGATGLLLTDKIIFVVSHDDDVDPLASTLTIMSSGRAGVTVTEVSDEATLHSSAVLQQFTIPSSNNLVGFYSTLLSHDQHIESHDNHSLTALGSLDQSLRSYDHSIMSHDTTARSNNLLQTSNLGGCIIVTSTCVYQCRQKRSPEVLFTELALNPKTMEKAEEFGITYKLDVCGLYETAAKKKLLDGQYNQALKLYEQSRCSPSKVIQAFSAMRRIPEMVQYLYQLVYGESSQVSQTNPKQVEDLLLLCFAHECLRCHGQPEGAVMMDKFTQFINDKFQYNQSIAMEILVQSGLKEQLFELAKTHRKLAEVLECLVSHGSVNIDPSILSSLASRQHVETLGLASNGLFLYQMSPSTFVRLLNSKPSILPTHIPHLLTLLPRMDISTLLRLVKLLDPSQQTIRPLLVKAHSHQRRSNSTGSLLSVLSSTSDSTHSEDPGPPLETYLELFLIVLIILNSRRRQKPAGVNPLLSLSPLRSAVSGNIIDQIIENTEVYTDGSQWLQASTLSAGLHHAATVANGNLYTWGSTKNGKLGHGEIEEEGRATPLRVETLSMLSIHVVSVSCGAEHTVALCQEGVFAWGSSSHGQLGHGDELKKTRPVQIAALADKSIISVACGQYHTLSLDDDHRVWSWGWGVHGQLGLKTVDNKLLPSHIPLLEGLHVSFIAAGYGHSAVLTSNGQVLTFGNGMYGQLGHGNKDKQVTPKVVEGLADKSVYLLACGNFHTVAITTGKDIYLWGKNMCRPTSTSTVQGLKEYKRSRERQQSSPINTAVNVQLPQLVTLEPPLEENIIQMSCGNFHSLLLTSGGSVYSWGNNNHGQLGHTHTSELVRPKKIVGFEGQKVVTIAAGDEFSLVIDENGQVWTWGRGDRGQLGLQSNQPPLGERERSTQLRPIFKPRSLSGIPKPMPKTRKRTSDNDHVAVSDLPVLELDLGWELPDFSIIGSPNSHYGRHSLNAALEALHGFYRTSALLWQCQDWNDWESLTKLYDIEHQWPQAVSCSLNVLVESKNQESIRRRAPSLVEHYIQKILLEERDPLSLEFIQDGLIFLQNLLSSWKKLNLENSSLEVILRKHVDSLSYPLSLILRSPEHTVLSLDFHLFVASRVISTVSSGNPSPETILNTSLSTETESKPKQLVIETSIGDCRLWVEVLRNLAKDLSKNSAVALSENSLNAVLKMQQKMATVNEQSDQSLIVAFTCGHTFPLRRFQNKIVQEFVERVKEFPLSMPLTLKHLQLHYKQSECMPASCPYCVFQYLRKIQLKECANVPIKPWNHI